jgi:hypothetical protein
MLELDIIINLPYTDAAKLYARAEYNTRLHASQEYPELCVYGSDHVDGLFQCGIEESIEIFNDRSYEWQQ